MARKSPDQAKAEFLVAFWVLAASTIRSRTVFVFVEGTVVMLVSAILRMVAVHDPWVEVWSFLAGLNGAGVMLYMLKRNFRRLLR